jgi:predicted Zn-dependent peptidase
LGRATLYGARDESGADAVAAALNESELSRVDLLDPPAFSHAYLSVTLDDINRVARRYYRPELLEVVATGAIPPVAQSRIFPDGTFRAIFEP